MANTSATRNEVNDFLTQMRLCLTKLNGYVIYNTQKRDWLLRLEVDDYFEGPDINEQPGLNSIWKFGKRIEGHLCYIKIFLQKPNVVCISFHLAEHDMYLPLKNITERA